MEQFFATLLTDDNVTAVIKAWSNAKLKNSRGISETQLYGVSGSCKHSIVAAAYACDPRTLVIVTPSRENLMAWREDLAALLPEADIYELPEVDEFLSLEDDQSLPNKSLERSARRMDILGKLLRGDKVIVLAGITAAAQCGLSIEEYRRHSLLLKLGDNLKRDALLKKLIDLGYQPAAEVEHVGEFSQRGGIVDIFPLNMLNPIRVEFFDEEIDSLRIYDANTRRSLQNIGEATVMPLRAASGKNTAAFLNYLSANARVVFDEPRRLQEELRQLFDEYAGNKKKFLNLDKLMLSARETGAGIFYISLMMRTVAGSELTGSIGVQMTAMTAFARQFSLLGTELARYERQQERVLILVGSEERAESLRALLRDERLSPQLIDKRGTTALVKIKPTEKGLLTIGVSNLRDGFELVASKVAIITERNIFGRHKVRLRKKNIADGDKISSFRSINLGDYVVHSIHGIGKYVGVETIEVAGIKRDYLKIQYGGDDKLFVPTDQVSLLHKYVGAEGSTPKLHRMGSADWARAKNRAQKSIEDIADHLLALYAGRKLAKGHAFTKDDSLQREFEEAFPYEETPDQLRAIVEIKKDMEEARPMDRLLCGDVGFGKTEVAVRAAFKAAMDGYQVAVLVPTTVLAQQHYQTFSNRFRDFAPRVDVICRFRTAKEQAHTLAELRKGHLDIIIGTHALLNSNRVNFKRLGLLIVDEEQRFGVKQKEKIKELSNGVDVLTLSATPIPRTLHMSLAGARDMSLIETPPSDRLPVQSYVAESSDEIMRSAIERELMRGGQVYFIYNSVKRIERMSEHLQSLVPEARIGIAHGQMNEELLETVMMDFYEGHYDVLCATSIVENGLDVANANTIIIYEADRFGLSQLYQMRGRVGRSPRMAFAYFLYRRDKVLTELAEKRLQAMKEFATLGAGFKIAMRDLEIRGAGNLLGAEQHGYIDGVGFELYVKMLEEAVAKKRGEKIELPQPEPFIDMPVEAYLESDYIENAVHKIEIYQKIARLRDNEEVAELLDEIVDRFGEPKAAALNLLSVARLKNYARDLKIRTISYKGNLHILELSFLPEQKLDLDAMVRLNNSYGKNVAATPEGGYRIKLNARESGKILDFSLKLLELLIGENKNA